MYVYIYVYIYINTSITPVTPPASLCLAMLPLVKRPDTYCKHVSFLLARGLNTLITHAMNEARLSHLPFGVPVRAFFLLIKRSSG